MTFYITRYNLKTLSKSFMNLRLLRFIDIEKILSEYDTYDDKYAQYIINKKIKEQIISALSSKRYNGVVYSNPNLTSGAIKNLKDIVEDSTKDIIFIDEKENTPDELQKHFKKILYFPTGSRKRIFKCEPIENDLFYWVNDIEKPQDL